MNNIFSLENLNFIFEVLFIIFAVLRLLTSFYHSKLSNILFLLSLLFCIPIFLYF